MESTKESPGGPEAGNGRPATDARRDDRLPPQHNPPLALPPAEAREPRHHGSVPRLNDPNLPPGKSHWWIWLIVLAVLGTAVYFLYPRLKAKLGSSQTTTGPGAKGPRGDVPVIAVPVKKEDLKIYLDGLLGNVTPLSTVTLRTRVDGQIMRTNFKEGEIVKEGASILEIDPRPYEVQLTQAKGNAARDAAQLSSAQQDLKRYQDAGTSVAVQQVEEQKALVAQYEGALKVDQGQIDAANLNITYCHVVAPITGRIGLRIVDVGNIVHASDQTGLVVITQMQPIAVVFSIPQVNIPRVVSQENGGAGLIALAYNGDLTGKPIATGTLTAADSQVDPTTGTLKLKATFENEDSSLFPNQFVNVKLLVQTLKGVLTIPNSAVQQGPDSFFAYVVKPDNTVALQTIKTGEIEGERTVVISGLNPGDMVVTDGVDKLVQGTKVSMRPQAGKGGAATHPASTTQSDAAHKGAGMRGAGGQEAAPQ